MSKEDYSLPPSNNPGYQAPDSCPDHPGDEPQPAIYPYPPPAHQESYPDNTFTHHRGNIVVHAMVMDVHAGCDCMNLKDLVIYP